MVYVGHHLSPLPWLTDDKFHKERLLPDLLRRMMVKLVRSRCDLLACLFLRPPKKGCSISIAMACVLVVVAFMLKKSCLCKTETDGSKMYVEEKEQTIR